MAKDELMSENALVFHISKISKSWNLINPYFISLRDLLLEDSGTKLNNLRKQQEYHFIAKIINDEINNRKNEINRNSKEISLFIKKYLKSKQQSLGDYIIRDLFYVFILRLLGKTAHFDKLDKNKIKAFLSNYQTQSGNIINFHKILSLFYLGIYDKQKSEIVESNLDLSINILFNRLLLANNEKREKSQLIDYYLKQNLVEKIDLTSSSENSKGKLLEIAVILKSANGKGLYIPEIEKEQYLSSFTQSIFREKYLTMLKESSSMKFFRSRIPLWSLILLFFVLESLVFLLPNFFETISIGNFSIPTTEIVKLPIWVILIINGIIMAVLIYVIQIHLNKRIREEKWK